MYTGIAIIALGVAVLGLGCAVLQLARILRGQDEHLDLLVRQLDAHSRLILELARREQIELTDELEA